MKTKPSSIDEIRKQTKNLINEHEKSIRQFHENHFPHLFGMEGRMGDDKIIAADDAILQERAKLLAELSDITKAADEVTRLRAKCNTLREENARLLEALKPFADRLNEIDKMKASKYACATSVEIEHLRAAAAAITKERGETEENAG